LRQCAERKEDRSCTARACRAFPALGRRESRRRRGAGLDPRRPAGFGARRGSPSTVYALCVRFAWSRVSSKTTAKGRRRMVKKRVLNRISISIPQSKLAEKPVERLLKVAKKRDRSPNHLVVEAILEYLKREEKKG